MTETILLDRPSRRAPPRVDESTLSKPLQDLFATWRQSLEHAFMGLTASGAVEPNLSRARDRRLDTTVDRCG